MLGAGALGSLYGAWSADAGHDVVLVARRPHADAIRGGGLTVRAVDGTSRVVELDATDDPSAAVGAEVVLVACKAPDTGHVLALVGPAAPAAVWSVQNGARQSEPLAARFGPAAIGCVSMVGATLDAPGRVSHTFTGATYLGPLAGSSAGAVDAVAASLGDISVERRDDIVDVLWSKAVLAAGAMGVSLLARLAYHLVFVEAPARRVFYDLVAEAAEVATAAGATLVDLPGPLQAGTLMTVLARRGARRTRGHRRGDGRARPDVDSRLDAAERRERAAPRGRRRVRRSGGRRRSARPRRPAAARRRRHRSHARRRGGTRRQHVAERGSE